MSAGLPELLQQTVPQPPHGLDPGVVLRAAKRRQSRRRSIATAAAAAVVAAVAAPLVLLPDAGEGQLAVADVPLRVSALEQRLPLGEAALRTMRDRAPLARPGEGTLVGVVEEAQVWLVGTADDELCLLLVDERTGSSGVRCTPRAELLDEGLVVVTRGARPDAPLLLAVAVPDGYTDAQAGGTTAAVRRAVALLAFDDGPGPQGELTISGPERPPVSFSLDGMVPPGGSPAPGRDAGEGVEAGARLQLHELTRRAAGYRREEGTLDGFLASLPAAYRTGAERLLADLTDTTARAVVDGTCLEADLERSTVAERSC